MTDTVSVNLIDDNILSPVGLYVKDNIVVNEDIKHHVEPDSLIITNIHYDKRNLFNCAFNGITGQQIGLR